MSLCYRVAKHRHNAEQTIAELQKRGYFGQAGDIQSVVERVVELEGLLYALDTATLDEIAELRKKLKDGDEA